jgi:hypothetical protein
MFLVSEFLGHFSHEIAGLSDSPRYVFASQGLHALDPAYIEMLPNPQISQVTELFWPVRLLNFPAGH